MVALDSCNSTTVLKTTCICSFQYSRKFCLELQCQINKSSEKCWISAKRIKEMWGVPELTQTYMPLLRLRGSHQRCSVKKSLLKNFTKFTEKHLCQSLFFNKITGLRRFPVNFVKFLGKLLLQNTSVRLLLKAVF